MKILFICGCLEPGKDGVGDYTRLLASELIKVGQQVNLIALYDHFVSREVEEFQRLQDVEIKVWRFSRDSPRRQRLVKVKEKLRDFNPDLVSLQFVAYSFHSKGLNLRLPFLLEQLSDKFQWHLMIHEPWLSDRKRKLRQFMVAFLQKKNLILIVEKLKPVMVHTSNLYYQKILMKGGIKSSILNLPGNIPVHKLNNSQINYEFAKLGITEKSRNEFLVLGTFGRIRTQMSYIALFESLFQEWDLKKKKIAFFSIGNAGNECSPLFDDLKRRFKDAILLHQFGERSPSEISSFFQLLDFGVASVPNYLLGKSGAYAAMRNHGLKILVPDTMTLNKENLKDEINTDYLSKIPDEDFSSRKVSKAFLASLNADYI